MQKSKELFQRAEKVIPGGVNSPVRACRSVQSDPLFIAKGKGSKLFTEDGGEFIDYVMSWGPMILGHAHPQVTEAVIKAVENGASYGAPYHAEVELAEAVADALPGVDMVRMVNSGTEATMSALRLARGFTGRSKVIKFDGCYHGHADAFLAGAGSGVATLSIPGSPGVPADTVKDTLLAPYNDLEKVDELFAEFSGDVACVIVEPAAGNMGLIPPAEGFLEGLRALCDKNDALLIFDEVITGFRIAYGGAQSRYNVMPDLTTLGKVMGGGFPVGAYGGKREIMQRIAPSGDIYQAGTLAGNPVAMIAGLETLRILSTSDYDGLEQRTKKLAESLADILRKKGVPVTLNQVASMFTMFFTKDAVTDFESAKTSDGAVFTQYYRQMRDQGIYLAPSGFECTMVSFAHSDEDMEKTLAAAENVNFS